MEKKKVFSMVGRVQWYVVLITCFMIYLPTQFTAIVIPIITAGYYEWFRRKSNTTNSFLKEQGQLPLAKKMFAGLALLGLSYLVAFGFSVLIGLFGFEAIGNIDEQALHSSNAWLELLLACVMAPVFEEFIYRGVVLQALLPYGRWFAIMCSSIFFSIMHGNLAAFPVTFTIGAGLCVLALKEKNIYFGMIIHAIFNANSTLGIMFMDYGFYILSNYFVYVCLILCFVHFPHILNVWKWVKEDKNYGEKIRTFVLRPANLVLMIVLILSAIGEYFI